MGQDRRSLTAFLLIGGVALALCTSLAWALWPSKPTGVADPTDATQVDDRPHHDAEPQGHGKFTPRVGRRESASDTVEF